MSRLFTEEELKQYVKEKFNSELDEFKELGKGTHGTGCLVTLKDGRRFVIKTLRGEDLGQEYPGDRAQVLLSAHYNYNKLPKHVKSLDVGAFTPRGIKSVGDMEEFFLIMEEIKGDDYGADLRRILETGELTADDKKKAEILADYLAEIHAKKHKSKSLYRRRIREAVGHNELMMGVIDLYSEDTGFATNDELTELVKKAVDWWNKVKGKDHRLCEVHGDFYYGNMVFDENNHLVVMDRSRGEFGEAAEDVVCMLINYLFFAIRQKGKFEGPFKELTEIFLKRYLEKTNDQEMLEIIPLFMLSRVVIVCCAVFHAEPTNEARRKLFDLTMKIADKDKFDLKDFEE